MMKVNSKHLAIAKLAYNIHPHSHTDAVRIERGGVLVATNGQMLVAATIEGEANSELEGTLAPHDVRAMCALQVAADIQRETELGDDDWCYRCDDDAGINEDCDLCNGKPLEFRISAAPNAACKDGGRPRRPATRRRACGSRPRCSRA